MKMAKYPYWAKEWPKDRRFRMHSMFSSQPTPNHDIKCLLFLPQENMFFCNWAVFYFYFTKANRHVRCASLVRGIPLECSQSGKVDRFTAHQELVAWMCITNGCSICFSITFLVWNHGNPWQGCFWLKKKTRELFQALFVALTFHPNKNSDRCAHEWVHARGGATIRPLIVQNKQTKVRESADLSSSPRPTRTIPHEPRTYHMAQNVWVKCTMDAEKKRYGRICPEESEHKAQTSKHLYQSCPSFFFWSHV